MGLPKAVQAQLDRAEKLSVEFAAKQQETENPELEEEEEVVIQDETELEEDLALEEEPESEEEEESEETLEGEEEEEEDDTEPKENTLEYWKQRFLILQGKYNSEVPALSQKVRSLELELENYKQLDIAPEYTKDMSELNPDDFGDYGDEFVSLVKTVNALEKRNKHLEKLAQGFQTQTSNISRETFNDRLAELVPDWETVNVNPDFITWLQNPDGHSGRTKYESLLNAHGNLKVKTVADIFNEFKTAFSIPVKKNKKPKNSLESEVTPRKQGQRNAPRKKIVGRKWTRADISKFYRMKAENKIDPKKAKEMEMDIFLANQEGRIVEKL